MMAVDAVTRPDLALLDGGRDWRADELRMELATLRAEAIELADDLLPLVSRLLPGLTELGPLHYQTALNIAGRLTRFRRQQDARP